MLNKIKGNNWSEESLKAVFLKLIGTYSKDLSYTTECWKEIAVHYSNPSRYYHNLSHLSTMLTELEPVRSQCEAIDTLLFSIFYHDIIYFPTKSDNEHQSALLFKKRISNTSFRHIEECMSQIEATKTHELSTDNDTNLLLDLDLVILGKDPEAYSTYSKNIRKEYRIYPNLIYRSGRKKVLEHFLSLPAIYKTEYFRKNYEAQARTNLQNEWEQL
ncbi:hypothetical protein [Altibacter sp.]|uniref:HD domain-containing protein n=1 Tax=Altibacter sp. TaxID=2024823 RepID=UPI000C892F7A|nr:hypothetical protein [Altibacter sp.]MAP54463.1 hypothetical protein [Altibacter sp.]|tara:strand:- start:223 stop:870 length:648 start_codon:yes stop_codon:yes gene_type:complete